MSISAVDTHPAPYSVDTLEIFPGAKCPGREADRSPPTTSEIKTEWTYNSTSRACVNGVDTDNFSL